MEDHMSMEEGWTLTIVGDRSWDRGATPPPHLIHHAPCQITMLLPKSPYKGDHAFWPYILKRGYT